MSTDCPADTTGLRPTQQGGSMQQNTLTLIGSLATDILSTTADDGTPIARFRIVTVPRRLDRETHTWVNGSPTFMTVTCSKRLATNVAASLRRGDPIIVTGRLRVREDRDKRLSRVEIDACGVGPDLNRVTAAPQRQQSRQVA